MAHNQFNFTPEPRSLPFAGAFPGGPYQVGAPRQDCPDGLDSFSPSPIFYPTFNSTSLSFVAKAVVNVAAGDNALVNAAGVALAAAENALNASNAELVTATLGAPTSFTSIPTWTYNGSEGWTTVISRWGISVLNNDPSAALVMPSIVGGPNTGNSPPDPRASSATAQDAGPTMIVLPYGVPLTWQIANLDASSPLLVQLAWYGWRIPSKFTGTLTSLVERNTLGYRMEC